MPKKKGFTQDKYGAQMEKEEKKLRAQGDRHMIRSGFPGEIARDQSRIPTAPQPEFPERGARKKASRFGVYI